LEAIGRLPGYAITVELNGTTHRLADGASTAALPEQEEKALAALRALVPTAAVEAATSPAWEAAAAIPHGSFVRVRDALVENGYVERVGDKGTKGQTFRPRPAM